MSINEVIQCISTVGFPIAMCCVLSYYVKFLNEKHTEETKSFSEALNRNTIVLERLCERMGGDTDESE